MYFILRRRQKKCMFIYLGLAIFILIVYKCKYFKQVEPSESRSASEMVLKNKDSKYFMNIFKYKKDGKLVDMNIKSENLNRLTNGDINTTDFGINEVKKKKININLNNTSTEPLPLESEKRDWHDYEAIKSALSRTGLGELGKPAAVEKDQFGKVDAAVKESFYNYGINGYLSDQISVNRSVPDHRAEVCKSTTYLANLPKVSVIIPFKDECFSTLVRTVHSIVNRTPPELLEEIILVDDNSKLENLKAKLDNYIKAFFHQVKLFRLLERNGLMRARLFGAKLAKSEILVIFDAHIEVGYNWLPPLIEPIVLNKKTCTLPYVDKIHAETMSYTPITGFRGGFDWYFYYHRLPLLSQNDEIIPHPNPVMIGCAFAIWTKFFWELGGYDNELQIWGGEQYELSFKIWMCGGTLLDIPCSRVAHIAQISHPIRYKGMNNSAVSRNYLRISEVWMDDYKKYIYQNIPERFKNVDIGDISIPKAVRENLQCKSFDWYLREIAFDSLKHYPYDDPAAFAGGTIRSIEYPNLCIAMKTSLLLLMLECAGNADRNNKKEQSWLFTVKGEIHKKGEMECMESKTGRTDVYMSDCHGLEGNQKWIHDEKQKIIIHAETNRCLVASKLNERLFLKQCNEDNDNLRWEFSWYNKTASINQSE